MMSGFLLLTGRTKNLEGPFSRGHRGRPQLRKTSSSTLPTATPFDGSICGRAWQRCLAWGRGSGPFSLVTYMAHKRPVWDAIVKKEKLRPIPYEQMVSWEYGDFAFRQGFDNVSSTIKVRRAGFHDCLDSETMFSQFFGK